MSAFSDVFSNIADVFKKQELVAILVPLSNALNAYAANPTAINGVAQLAKLQAEVFASQPGLLQGELVNIAGVVAKAAADAVAAATPKP